MPTKGHRPRRSKRPNANARPGAPANASWPAAAAARAGRGLKGDDMTPSRADAWATVCEFTKSENLRRHMLAVEAVMRAYARRFGSDEEQWASVGLLHDFDYERFPDEHPQAGARVLAERGWPDDVCRAVLSHAAHTGVSRETLMERALHASDDVTGLVVATALVQPSHDLRQVKLSSVRKKWKDRSFAGGVDRDEAAAAAAAIEMPLDEHLGVVLSAMQSIADELALGGS
jgi:putative nucleotidyltransferase with HDIG domain